MGVKGLMNLLKTYAPHSIKTKKYNEYSGWTVALDMSMMIYKFVIAIRGKGTDLTRSDGKMTSHIVGCSKKIINLLKFGIIPVAVFDGPAPIIKKETLTERKRRKIEAIDKLNSLSDDSVDDEERIKYYKRTFRINEDHIHDIKRLFELMGFIYIQSPSEADPQCAVLNIANIVNGVVSEDMDILAFGAPVMLKTFSSKTGSQEINLQEALTTMGLTHDQFIDICIILGSDYCKSIKGIGAITTYKIYKKTGNMHDFLNELNNVNKQLIENNKNPKYQIPNDFLERWKHAKEYYTNAEIISPYNYKILWKKPNNKGIYDFLCIENEMKPENVEDIITYINHKYKEYKKYGKLKDDLK